MEIPPSNSSLSVHLTKDGSPTLFSERYQQTYHSKHGSVTESNHIFLNTSGIKKQLKKGIPTRILEVGLGTGLNFLLTAREAITNGTPLSYWAFEHTILSLETFHTLKLEAHIPDPDLLDTFARVLKNLELAVSGNIYTFSITPTIQLSVLKGDATQVPLPNEQFHAVFQDAFSPDVNPELWTPLFFQRIYDTMHPGGRLTTFSVRRLVRENLTSAGFLVQKKPGPPGGKREMVLATKPNHAQSDTTKPNKKPS